MFSEVAEPTNLMQVYLRDIRPESSLLSREEEQVLFRQFLHGQQAETRLAENGVSGAQKRQLQAAVRAGEDAQHELLLSNTRLVISIAKRYQGLGLTLLDLIQEGNLGLMKAIKRFEPERGFRFSTYATWWIRQSVTRAVGNQGRTIRLPIHQIDRKRKIKHTRAQLVQELNRTPSLEEIADAADLRVDQVSQTLRATRDLLALDELVDGEETSRSRADLIADSESVDPEVHAEQALLTEDMARMIEELPARQALVLRLYYGLVDNKPHSLAEIGERLGRSRERVRQIRNKALRSLRRQIERKYGRQEYLMIWS